MASNELHAGVFILRTRGFRAQGFRQESHAVISRLDLQNVSKGGDQSRCGGVAHSQKVEIACRAIRRRRPEAEQHGAFQDEFFAVRREAQAIEQALDGIAGQNELNIFSRRASALRQPIAHGGAHVLLRSARHESASR